MNDKKSHRDLIALNKQCAELKAELHNNLSSEDVFKLASTVIEGHGYVKRDVELTDDGLDNFTRMYGLTNQVDAIRMTDKVNAVIANLIEDFALVLAAGNGNIRAEDTLAILTELYKSDKNKYNKVTVAPSIN